MDICTVVVAFLTLLKRRSPQRVHGCVTRALTVKNCYRQPTDVTEEALSLRVENCWRYLTGTTSSAAEEVGQAQHALKESSRTVVNVTTSAEEFDHQALVARAVRQRIT